MRALITSVFVACTLLFTGMAGAADKPVAEKRTFEQVRSAGTLRIGVYLLEPYVMQGASGLVGSEIDVATRVARDMGVTPHFKLYDWSALIPALQKGEIDIIVSGMSITPDRALQVYFSNPYQSSGVSLATNIKLTREFGNLSDLNNPQVAIGALAGTVSEQIARDVFDKAAIKTFTDEKQAEDALVKGLLHAYVRSEPEPRFIALRHPGEIDVPITRPLLSTQEGFAVRRGDHDFVNFLNAWIATRTADAWLASTHRFWFDSLDWQREIAAPAVSK